MECRSHTEPSQPVPVHVLPTFSCDQRDAVYGKLRALRLHQVRAHQRRREARLYVLDSVCPSCKADLRSRPRVIQHLEVGAMRSALAWRFGVLQPYPEDAVAAGDKLQAGKTPSFGRTAHDEERRRWRLSTMLPCAGMLAGARVRKFLQCFSDGRLLVFGERLAILRIRCRFVVRG